MPNPRPPGSHVANSDMESRLNAAERLLKLFQMERYAYLSATLLALAFLMGTAIILVVKESYALAFGMFGATGVITFTIGRILYLWNNVFQAIFGQATHGDD